MKKTHHYVLVKASTPEALTARLNEAHAGSGRGARLVAADLEGCTALVEYQNITTTTVTQVDQVATRWPEGIDNITND
jgi:hypothetical protein